MELAFYLSALVAIATTLRVITHTNPVHALLYLIISLMAISCVFFSLGANFAGALEIIVYAGAIMVLFVFVVMMLNLGDSVIAQEKAWLTPKVWFGPSLLAALLLLMLLVCIFKINTPEGITGTTISAKEVGKSMFSVYILAIELISMLLLAGLVVAFHVGRNYSDDEVVTHSVEEDA